MTYNMITEDQDALPYVDIISRSGFWLRADKTAPVLTGFGFDTENTGRNRIQYLKDPICFHLLKDGMEIQPVKITLVYEDDRIEYRIDYGENFFLYWYVYMIGNGAEMSWNYFGLPEGAADTMELVLSFDPTAAVTSIIGSRWSENGDFILPVIMSVPDIGQLLVSCQDEPMLTCRIDGSRSEKWAKATFIIPIHKQTMLFHLRFMPLILSIPSDFQDTERWEKVRRGWFDLIQLSCGASGGGERVKGVWSNNTLSDPVSSVLYMLCDAALLVPELSPGINMSDILKKTVEYWMYEKTDEKGLVAYTALGIPYRDENRSDEDAVNRQNLMDSNAAVLIGAFSYVRASGNMIWLEKNIARLELLSDYLEKRDIDNDGLVESPQSGNRGSQPPVDADSAYDCYSSGHKNAYINALVYRAWHSLSELESLLKRNDRAQRYGKLANRIKAVFYKTFYNKKTGWLGYWVSEDGELHDIYTDIPTSIAVAYGIVNVRKGRRMLRNFIKEIKRSGFDRFDLGIPLNTRPVPDDEMNHHFAFQYFLNGGCCVSNTANFINALYMTGIEDMADMILNAMIERQYKGVFKNGGGFQNGFVDKMGFGAEVFDWKGNPAGYEGHLVYCWNFLHSMLMKEPILRDRVYPKGMTALHLKSGHGFFE